MQMILFSSLPAVFLSGFSWPPEAIPGWLRALAIFLPSTAGIRGFLRMNQMGAALGEVRGDWLVLWGLCLIYLVAARLAGRRSAAPA